MSWRLNRRAAYHTRGRRTPREILEDKYIHGREPVELTLFDPLKMEVIE